MNNNAFFSLTRSYMHAKHLFKLMHNESPPQLKDVGDVMVMFTLPFGTYWLYWYATLYNVCEKLNNTKNLPASIREDFDSIRSDWERCRHLAFHVKPDFFSDNDFAIFMNRENDGYEKIKRIHLVLDALFESSLASKTNPFR